MRFSIFRAENISIPAPMEMSWDQFVIAMGSHDFTYHNKKGLPAFSPAEFKPGTAKLKKNVLRVAFGVLDLDLITAEQLLTVLRNVEGHNAIFYTTWSHPETFKKRGLWKCRICIEFARPVDVQAWPLVWGLLNGRFGAGVNDPQCKDPSHIYYGPFQPPGTESDAIYYQFRGEALDTDTLIAQRYQIETAPVTGTDKIGRDRLERLALRWKRSRDEYRSFMGETLHKLTKGEPFAEEHNVDNTVFKLCNDIAAAFPTSDPKSIAEHFAQSLQLMNYSGLYPLDKVEDKLRRALANGAAEIAAEQEAEITERKLRMRQAFAHLDPERDYAYTETELNAMAERLECSREEMQKRWIIQLKTLFYVLGPNAVYSQAYTQQDVGNAIMRDLAPALSAGVELWSASTGEFTRKSVGTLMDQYGSVATSFVLDMRAQEARYEPTIKQFIEAPCPLRPLAPAYDHDVARWLNLMCGDKIHDVLTWMACSTYLDEVCAALMLTGPGGAGKSLFAEGMARLWSTSGASKLSSAMDPSFNEAMAQCPLIFGDEQLPKDFRGFGRTGEIREFIAAFTRPYKKKYAPEGKLIGAIRLVIAANNEELLAIPENLSINDIEAIGDRFYHVRVQAGAIEYLKACNARSFVHEDRIAKHALWLRDNHRYQRNGRFIIKSPDRTFYRALTTKTGIRSAVCQWLVGYLREPRRVDQKGDFGVRVKYGALCVTAKTVLDNWDLYVQNEKVPTTGALTRAITGLSQDERWHLSIPAPVGGTKHYRVIDSGHLRAWAQETEFASLDEIENALSVDTEKRLGR